MITYVRTFIVNGKFQWQMIIGIVLGVVCAAAFGVDLFQYVGMTSNIPYIGVVLTGILVSRGSNYVFDLLGKATEIKG